MAAKNQMTNRATDISDLTFSCFPLGQSVRTIQDELQHYVKSLIHETDLLLDQKSRLEKSLKTLNTVSYINSTCLRYRNDRPAPDLVRDDVDGKLLKVC